MKVTFVSLSGGSFVLFLNYVLYNCNSLQLYRKLVQYILGCFFGRYSVIQFVITSRKSIILNQTLFLYDWKINLFTSSTFIGFQFIVFNYVD